MYAADFLKALVHSFDHTRRIQHSLQYEDRCRGRGTIPVYSDALPYDHLAWTKAVLAEFHRCEVCGSKAEVAHRVRPAELFPEIALHVGNGVGLCHACHCKVHVMLRCKSISTVIQLDSLLTIPDTKLLTIEELAAKTGFAVKTIYNLTSYGCLPSPVRGIATGTYRSKGAYSELALDMLYRYASLKDNDIRKERAIRQLKWELQQKLYEPVLALPIDIRPATISVEDLATYVGTSYSYIVKLSAERLLPPVVSGSIASDVAPILDYALSTNDVSATLSDIMTDYYLEVVDVPVR